MKSTFEKELEGKETWLMKGCIIDNRGIKSPIMKDVAILPRDDVLSARTKAKKKILDEIDKKTRYVMCGDDIVYNDGLEQFKQIIEREL